MAARAGESTDQQGLAPAADRRGPHRGDLTSGPIGRTLFLFSLPVLGSNVLHSLNGSVNAVWVGRFLGETGLTATANANIILFFLLGVVFGVGMAATILVGQAVGARNVLQARRVIGTGTTFFAISSLIVALGGYLLAPSILHWMGTPPAARPLATDYLRIIFLALPFMYFFTFIMMALRGVGDAKTPFYCLVLAVLLDIGLNPLLILGLGPFPRLGIAGSAVATLVSQMIGLAALIAIVYAQKNEYRLRRQDLGMLRPDRVLLRSMVLKGIPMGLQMVIISGSAIILMSLVNSFGVETAAAYGVAVQFWTYVQMPAMAIGAACSSIAAQSVGAGLWDRVGQTTRAGVITNIVMTGSLVAIILLVEEQAFYLFLPGHDSAVAIASHINRIALWSFVLFGIVPVIFGVTRATGAVIAPLIILAVSIVGVRVPFALLLTPYWGADALWWSFPLGSAVALILSVAFYLKGDWKNATMLVDDTAGEAPETGVGTPAMDRLAAP